MYQTLCYPSVLTEATGHSDPRTTIDGYA